jgi:hypothetical protein
MGWAGGFLGDSSHHGKAKFRELRAHVPRQTDITD